MNNSNAYINNLIKTVLDNSVSKIWERAVFEWEILDVIEDESMSGACICGHPNLKYQFSIVNKKNAVVLFPIGSSCINKFGRDDLDDCSSIWIKMYELFHAIKNREYIEFGSKYFSRRLLEYFDEKDVFEGNEYNDYDGHNDYEFLLKMFNKRNITDRQDKKVKAILLNSIFPYLKKNLKFRDHK